MTVQLADALFNLVKGLLIVEWVDIDITNIESPQSLVDLHFHLLTIVAAENRGLTNGVRPEAGAGTEGHQAIKRNAQDGQIDRLIIDVSCMRQTTEGREPAERRLMEWPGGTSFLVLVQISRSNSV